MYIHQSLISFSARGTEFKLPQEILKKYPESLLHILSQSNLPVDKIDSCIYIDIDPIHINTIIDYYMMDIPIGHGIEKNNIFMNMDMLYLNLKNESSIDVRYNMRLPIIYNDNKNVEYQNVTQKWCKIHTRDNQTILVDLSPYRNRRKNKFLSAIFGIDEEGVMNISNDVIDVWIGLPTFVINNLISVLRDGFNWYYGYLENIFENLEKPRHGSLDDKFMRIIQYNIRCIKYFGLADEFALNQLSKRLYADKSLIKFGKCYTETYSIIGEKGDITIFTKNELEQGKCLLKKDSRRANAFRIICQLCPVFCADVLQNIVNPETTFHIIQKKNNGEIVGTGITGPVGVVGPIGVVGAVGPIVVVGHIGVVGLSSTTAGIVTKTIPNFSDCSVGDKLIGDIKFMNVDVQLNEKLFNCIYNFVHGI